IESLDAQALRELPDQQGVRRGTAGREQCAVRRERQATAVAAVLEARQSLSTGQLPADHVLVAGDRGKRLAAGREYERQRRGAVPRPQGEVLVRRQVPQTQRRGGRSVAAQRQPFAVGGEGQTAHTLLRTWWRRLFACCFQVPQPDMLIVPARGQRLPTRRER